MIGTAPQFRANSSKLNRQPVWWSLWRSGGWGESLFKVYFPSTEQAAQNLTDNLCGDLYGGGGGDKITLLSIYFPSTEQTEQNSTSIKIVWEGDTCITDREESLLIKHLA